MKHYLESPDAVFTGVGGSKAGLSSSEAEKRLAENGKNKLAEGKKKSMISRIWDQIKDPMVLVLLAAAVISAFSGEIADTVIIMVVVVLNAILGIVQESKAEKAIEALQKMSAPMTRVRRDGEVIKIKSEDLVVGDIVLLEAGDAVPADLRLFEAASLKIEEAALTGESVPVEKSTEAIEGGEKDIPLGDRTNMAYMGTNVSYGRGAGVVVAVGMETELGKIAEILAATDEEKTPLQQTLAGLSKFLSIAVLGICVFIFFFNIFQDGQGFTGANVLESLLGAVSLAVAAIPEGLVVVVTVLLSIGVTKMSAKNAIIRRLTAVETLGCTEIICSDKTGTLTQNKMTVVETYGEKEKLATAMRLCTDVQVATDGAMVGDPTEVALVVFAQGYNVAALERVGEAPFDSVRKMMTTVHADGDKFTAYTKGAPDEVLKKCTSILKDGKAVPITEEDKAGIIAENKKMADKALRVLAAAYKEYSAQPQDESPEALENDLVFVGLTGMIDPVRPEVSAAIVKCKAAGIRAIMITGDHKDTAVAIAKELGIIKDESEAVTGAELSELSDAEFEKRIKSISVYARVQPEHKVRIVTTWKKLGKITAMTGDGVNDAPAIKSADIGVGMGITGTDVTKNVADMVLADDNFATIVCAVEEGRRIYDNIRKAIQFLLASNLSEVVSIFIATLLKWHLFAPIHILWINLVTDTFPAMALGMEPAEPDIMQKPPRKSKEGVFSGGLGFQVIYQGIIIAGLTLWSYFIGSRVDGSDVIDKITGMTMAFLTLSLCEVFHAINMRSRTKSIFALKHQNKFLIGATVLSFILTLGVIYIPGLNTVFSLVPLSLANFLEAFGIALLIIPIVEVVKGIGYLFRK